MSFPSIESGDLVRCHRYLTHRQTLKERATQLMRSRSRALVTQLGCHRLCVSASVRSGQYNVEQLSRPKQRICTVQLPRRRRMQMVTLCWYHWYICVKMTKNKNYYFSFLTLCRIQRKTELTANKTKFQYFLATNGVSCKEFRWEKHLVWVVKVCKAYRYDGRKNRTVLTHLHIPNSFTFGLPV